MKSLEEKRRQKTAKHNRSTCEEELIAARTSY